MCSALQVSIEEELHGASAAAASCLVGERISIYIPRPRLWSPDDPHLYQVSLQLVERSSDDSLRGARNVGDQVHMQVLDAHLESLPSWKDAGHVDLHYTTHTYYDIFKFLCCENKTGWFCQVNSYFGMRKVSVAKDKNGRPRIKLNNKVRPSLKGGA